MDFTAQARAAIYATLSPEAVLSPSAYAAPAPPDARSPLAYPAPSPTALDPASYSELVAAARAAVASLPAHTLPRLPGAAGSPQRASALLSELGASVQRLHALRGAAAGLEAQRRTSPTSALLASALQRSSAAAAHHAPPSPPRSAAAAAAASPAARLTAADLSGSGSGGGGGGGGRFSPGVPGLGSLRASLSASAQRLEAASAGLGAAAAAATSLAAAAPPPPPPAAAAPPLPQHRLHSPGLTPLWLERSASGAPSPLPPAGSSSAAPSPLQPLGAAAAARARFASPAAATPPSRKRPLPASPAPPPPPPPPPAWAYLNDAHAAQRSAEACYLAAAEWRAHYHTPRALDHPEEGQRLVTHALRSLGVQAEAEAEAEEAGAEGRGGEQQQRQQQQAGSEGDALLGELCAAAGLEWQERGQLAGRVRQLARAAVECSGLSAFAARVSGALSAQLLGLGEVLEEDGRVRYGPLRQLGEEQAALGGGGGGGGAQQGLWGPAYCSLPQAEALLGAALKELSAHRVLRAHGQQHS
jgi:hypothetical protein